MHGIPESSRVDDQPPSGAGGGWGGASAQPEDGGAADARRLLQGADKVQLSPPALGALGIVQGCLLDAISDALQVPRRAGYPIRTWALAKEPRGRAEQICSQAGAMLQRAMLEERPHAGQALARGAKLGMERAMDVLASLGHLDGEAGEAVAELLEAWALQLVRLTDRAGG